MRSESGVGKLDGPSRLAESNLLRDAAILASLPGNGRIVLATLLAEGWEALQRRDYRALRTLCGAAPVTKRSGKSCIVTRRLACNPRLQNALYHWARVARAARSPQPRQVRRSARPPPTRERNAAERSEES
jgi:transposase